MPLKQKGSYRSYIEKNDRGEVGLNLYPGEVIKLHRAGFEHNL